jgi:hypothetical protein
MTDQGSRRRVDRAPELPSFLLVSPALFDAEQKKKSSFQES